MNAWFVFFGSAVVMTAFPEPLLLQLPSIYLLIFMWSFVWVTAVSS